MCAYNLLLLRLTSSPPGRLRLSMPIYTFAAVLRILVVRFQRLRSPPRIPGPGLFLVERILQKDLTDVKQAGSLTAMTPPLTTKQAATKVGITRATLQAWIKAKKITPPKPTLEGARSKRLWSESEVARLKKAKGRLYWKGQGRPRKKK
jgi:predicted DNA-binding transcriptional regulator AlpA